MLHASLYEFVMSGCLANLAIRMHADEVEGLIGSPEDILRHPGIVHHFYGCVQIQYSATEQIDVISVAVNDPQFPEAGKSIKLDPWLIRPKMNPAKLLRICKDASIGICECPASDDLRTFFVNNVIVAAFDKSVESNDYEIWSLSSTCLR